jgi:hypothetical protein
MKTIVIFVITWVTATALLLWLANHPHSATLDLGGAQVTWSESKSLFKNFWHWLAIGGVYAAVNTVIVSAWQMFSGKKS